LVQARIFASGQAVKSGVMVPQDAVQTWATARWSSCAPDGFRARPVQVGKRSEGLVSITSGLAPGMAIATTNAFLLKAEIEKNEGGDE
jgi:cobalt-zinc-cadmium efflux system membrane fusion protein